MIAVYKKELRSYFTSMVGYSAITMILVMAGIFVKIVCFDNGIPMMEYALPTVSMILLLAVPIITMSSFAAEKQTKTDQLLYSLPISTSSIVAGKYFAMLTVFAVPTLILGLVPAILTLYGNVDLFATYSALLVFFLLIAAMTAICMFASTLTDTPITAAVLGAAVLVATYYSATLTSVIPKTEIASLIAFLVLGASVALAVYAFVRDFYIAAAVGTVIELAIAVTYYFNSSLFLGLIQRAVSAFSLFDRFDIAVRSAVLDINTVVYYLSVSLLFAFLTVQTVEKRRYN
jgi:ABC-2 type transport system permease protein